MVKFSCNTTLLISSVNFCHIIQAKLTVDEVTNLEFIINDARENSHMAVHYFTHMKQTQVNWIGHILCVERERESYGIFI
jgi:hypothetical protein